MLFIFMSHLTQAQQALRNSMAYYLFRKHELNPNAKMKLLLIFRLVFSLHQKIENKASYNQPSGSTISNRGQGNGIGHGRNDGSNFPPTIQIQEQPILAHQFRFVTKPTIRHWVVTTAQTTLIKVDTHMPNSPPWPPQISLVLSSQRLELRTMSRMIQPTSPFTLNTIMVIALRDLTLWFIYFIFYFKFISD